MQTEQYAYTCSNGFTFISAASPVVFKVLTDWFRLEEPVCIGKWKITRVKMPNNNN